MEKNKKATFSIIFEPQTLMKNEKATMKNQSNCIFEKNETEKPEKPQKCKMKDQQR